MALPKPVKDQQPSGCLDEMAADNVSQLRDMALQYRENEHTACSQYCNKYFRAERSVSARQRDNRDECSDSREDRLFPPRCCHRSRTRSMSVGGLRRNLV
jgi:hypothetical protein